MWMGQWTPFIFSYSSNWKELQTLLLTLQNIARDAPTEVYGTTLFYFTDNMVTYYINASGSSRSPGLHALIEQTRYHELLLNYRAATTPARKRYWARAGLANVLLWLGWLRSAELLGLRIARQDVKVHVRVDHHQHQVIELGVSET